MKFASRWRRLAWRLQQPTYATWVGSTVITLLVMRTVVSSAGPADSREWRRGGVRRGGWGHEPGDCVPCTSAAAWRRASTALPQSVTPPHRNPRAHDAPASWLQTRPASRPTAATRRASLRRCTTTPCTGARCRAWSPNASLAALARVPSRWAFSRRRPQLVAGAGRGVQAPLESAGRVDCAVERRGLKGCAQSPSCMRTPVIQRDSLASRRSQ